MSISIKLTLYFICNIITICLVDLTGRYFKWWPSVLNFEEILIVSGFYALFYVIEDMFEKYSNKEEYFHMNQLLSARMERLDWLIEVLAYDPDCDHPYFGDYYSNPGTPDDNPKVKAFKNAKECYEEIYWRACEDAGYDSWFLTRIR